MVCLHYRGFVGWLKYSFPFLSKWLKYSLPFTEFLMKQENADNQARMSIQIVDSAGNVFEPVGDFTVKVANADVGDS